MRTRRTSRPVPNLMHPGEIVLLRAVFSDISIRSVVFFDSVEMQRYFPKTLYYTNIQMADVLRRQHCTLCM